MNGKITNILVNRSALQVFDILVKMPIFHNALSITQSDQMPYAASLNTENNGLI
jgi:ABC-type uncharacterized transport system permease subunit